MTAHHEIHEQGHCRGWIPAFRESWFDPAFPNLRDAGIWQYLYQNAVWEQEGRSVPFNGRRVHLQRGQIITSIRYLAEGFKVSEKVIRRALEGIEKGGLATLKRAHHGTVITICNYGVFLLGAESEGTPETAAKAQQGHAEGTNNNKVTNKEDSIEANASMSAAPAPDAMPEAEPEYPNSSHPAALPGQLSLAIPDPAPVMEAAPVTVEAPPMSTGAPEVDAPVIATAGAVVVQFPAPAAPPPLIDPKAVVFGMCRQWLERVTGKPEAACRKLLGQWISRYTAWVVLTVMESASRNPPPTGDFVPWLIKGMENELARSGPRAMEPGAAAFLRRTDKYFQGAN